MRYAKILTSPLATLLVACASLPNDVTYDPSSMARIRIYKTGTEISIIIGDVCSKDKNPIVDASSPGLAIFHANRALGIPLHDRMPVSRYDEYAIPAERLVTIKHYWQGQHPNGSWMRYGPTYVQFTPQPGLDYEAWTVYEGGTFRGPRLQRVSQQADGNVLIDQPPVHGPPFTRCR